MPFRGAQERKEEGAKSEAGKSDAETPVEAQDLTVFVQSVMEQMVRENHGSLNEQKGCEVACVICSIASSSH